jgi:hypothetical protein
VSVETPCSKAGALDVFAARLCENAGPLHAIAPPLDAFAQRLHEGDERITEELRGHHEFEGTPETRIPGAG